MRDFLKWLGLAIAVATAVRAALETIALPDQRAFALPERLERERVNATPEELEQFERLERERVNAARRT